MNRNGIRSLLLSLHAREPLSEDDAGALAELFTAEERHASGELIATCGDRPKAVRLLLSGLVAASRNLGERRQITAVYVPGDLLDLHGLFLSQLQHSLTALSSARTAVVTHARLREAMKARPRLSDLVIIQAMVDASIHREWILSSGRRSSRERLVSFLCELIVRLRTVGIGREGCYPISLTQNQLADVCGISAVHVNRVLGELRKEGVVELRGRELRFSSFEKLASIAKFDSGYLAIRPQTLERAATTRCRALSLTGL